MSLMSQEIVLKARCQDSFGMEYGGFVLNLIGTGKPNFRRQTINFPKSYVEDFPQDMNHWLADMAMAEQRWDSIWKYPRSWACIGRYGACEYLPLCKYGSSRMSEYRVVR